MWQWIPWGIGSVEGLQKACEMDNSLWVPRSLYTWQTIEKSFRKSQHYKKDWLTVHCRDEASSANTEKSTYIYVCTCTCTYTLTRKHIHREMEIEILLKKRHVECTEYDGRCMIILYLSWQCSGKVYVGIHKLRCMVRSFWGQKAVYPTSTVLPQSTLM